MKYDSYEQYLKSSEWKSVKSDYYKNESSDRCLICNCFFGKDFKTLPNLHHFIYTKDWTDDSYDNLIIVCKECHKWLHSEFEHNSEKINLRDYLSKAIRKFSLKGTVSLEEIWCDIEDNFTIKRKALGKPDLYFHEVRIKNQKIIDYYISQVRRCDEEENVQK